MNSAQVAQRKQQMRAQISASRRAMPSLERIVQQRAIDAAISGFCDQLPAGSTVAAFQPLPSEPLAAESLNSLAASGIRVLVPITQPDNDLTWRLHSPDVAASTPDLGLSAIAEAAVILVPAFAADRHGNRLGRGGGSYDRALQRARGHATLAAVLFSAETVDEVPTDRWDRPVTALVTPAGWHSLGGGGQASSEAD